MRNETRSTSSTFYHLSYLPQLKRSALLVLVVAMRRSLVLVAAVGRELTDPDPS